MIGVKVKKGLKSYLVLFLNSTSFIRWNGTSAAFSGFIDFLWELSNVYKVRWLCGSQETKKKKKERKKVKKMNSSKKFMQRCQLLMKGEKKRLIVNT